MTAALSPREIEVLQLAARGMCLKRTASAMGITEHTAKSHRKHINRALDAKNMAQAVAIGVARGYIKGDGA